MPGQWIKKLDPFDLVIEQLDPHRMLSVLGREDINHITAYPEGAALKVHLVTRVLHLGQALEQIALRNSVALAYVHDHLVVFVAVTDTVDTRHGGHDDAIGPFDQTLGRRQTHLLDVFVDR